MNEQVRHRAVQALEGEPGKVARAGADTTQRHLGHALGGKAGNEAVAQVARAADVDVAPCRRKYPRGPRGSGSAPRLPSWGCEGTAGCPAASETAGGQPPAWPRRWGPPGWPASARVVVPKGHKRAHEFREGSSCLAAPMRASVGQQVDLGARVVTAVCAPWGS